MISQGVSKLQRAIGSQGGDKFGAVHDPVSTPVKRGGGRGRASLQKVEFDMIVVGQDDVGKGQCHLASGGKLLSLRWKGHGATRIHKEIDKEIHLLTEQFNVKSIAAGENSPVEITDIVPW